MSDAIHAQGTVLAFGDGASPENFTDVAEVLSIDGPTLTSDTIDVTNQSSPGRWREKIAGLRDGGELTFDVNYLPQNSTQDGSTGILSKFVAGTVNNWRITFPDSPVVAWTFAAFLTQFSPASEIESQLKASITLTVTGQPTLA